MTLFASARKVEAVNQWVKQSIQSGIYLYPKTSEKWVTVTSPDDLFKHGIDVDYKQMGCGEILNN